MNAGRKRKRGCRRKKARNAEGVGKESYEGAIIKITVGFPQHFKRKDSMFAVRRINLA